MTDYERVSIARQTWQIWVSIGVGALALFLPGIHNLLWKRRPKLALYLNDPPGGLPARISDNYWQPYHHIKIVNRGSVANNTALYCVGFERAMEDGTFKKEKIPRIRLKWPFEDIMKKEFAESGTFYKETRNVIGEELCDLCHLTKDYSGIVDSLVVKPLRLAALFKDRVPIRLHLKAFSDNFESKKPLVIELRWNGKWTQSENEMIENFVVKEVGS